MGQIGNVTVKIDAQSDGWMKGLDEAGKETRKWVGHIKGEFSQLSAPFKDGFKIAGLGLASYGLEKVTSGIESAVTGLREGASASEMFHKAVDGIPIVGQGAQIGASLREIITGEKSAAEEARKYNEMLDDTIEMLTRVRHERNVFGVYGENRAKQDLVNNADIERGQIADKLKKDQEAYDKLWFSAPEIQNGGKTLRILTGPQEDQLKGLEGVIKADKLGESSVAAKLDQALKDLKLDTDEQARLFAHSQHEMVLDLQAEADARILRRSGRPIPSAEVSVTREWMRAISQEQELIAPEVLKTLTPEHRSERLHEAHEAIDALWHGLSGSIIELRDLQAVDMAQIKESLRADTQKQMDSLKGAELGGYDLDIDRFRKEHGLAGGSHMADKAAINNDFEAASKKAEADYKARNKTTILNRDDPIYKQQIEDAGKIRDQRQHNLDMTGHREVMADMEQFGKEKVGAWASTGDAFSKYLQSSMAIEQQADRLKDYRLRDRQMGDLNRQTATELMGGRHENFAKDLYGVPSTMAKRVNVSGGTSGRDVAEKQLQKFEQAVEILNTMSGWIQQMYNYANQEFGGSAGSSQEMNVIFGGF